MTTPTTNTTALLRSLLPYVRRRWTGLLAIIIITLVTSGLTLLAPWPMKFIIDHVLLSEPLPTWVTRMEPGIVGGESRLGLLWWSVAAMVLLFLLSWIVRLASAIIHVSFGQRMVYDLAADLYAHFQRLSLRFHHRKAIGDSIRRVTSDCGCVSAIIRDAMLPVVSSVVMLLIMVSIMWQLDRTLTLLAVCVMPALVTVLRLYARPMMDRSYIQQDIEGRLYSEIEQTFSAIPIVQVFKREELHDRQFRIHTENAISAALATTNLQLQFKILVGLCTAFGTAAIIYVGAQHVLAGTLTVGTILVYLAYLASLYGPIESIMYSSFAVQGAAGSARRVVEILSTQREVDNKPGAATLTSATGQVIFEGVSFSYEPGQRVLHDICLEIAAGETVAIVGATGAGKTTLVSLVPRFIDPQVGRVLLDGYDLRDLRLESLRRQISLVLQDSFLFPVSIAENIAYGRPEATRDQIVEVARMANALQFIMRLPEGFDTPVGERGTTLSGGERQRIAIARALLRDAPVLIFDEPTSNLDAETEAAVMQATRRLMCGRTTLVIAHRLSTVRHADRIVVLEQGRIVESGTHEQLLDRGGAYAGLYRTQDFIISGELET